jgi:integrase
MTRRKFTVKLYSREWKTNGKKKKAWGVRYHKGGQYVSQIVGDTREVAQDFADRLRQDYNRRVLGVAEGKTFADLAPLFLTHKETQERHLEAIQLRVRNLEKYFREMVLEDITAEAIDGYISKRKAEAAPLRRGNGSGKVKNATINRDLAVLRHMLRLAVRKWRWLRQEPYFEMLPEGEGRERELTEVEEKTLLSHFKPAFADLFLAALHTGMRQGELVRLEWRQVNLADRVLDFQPTKRGKKRAVPIGEPLYHILARRKQTPSTSGRVFVKSDGEPWSKWAVGYHVNAACEAAGIQDFTFHDIRHTVATRLNRNGVQASYVQDLLGHKTASITRRYTHTQTSDLAAAVATLENWTKTEHGSNGQLTSADKVVK